MAEVHISPEFIGEAARHPAVRAELHTIARKIERQANILAAAEDVDMETRIEDSIRPKGRPQSVVWGDNVEQEYGSYREGRRRILGRAAQAVAK